MAVGEGKSGANPGPTTQHLVGQGPCALPGVRYGIGGRTGASAPTEALQGVQWAGDRKGRPYGVLRGMCGRGIGPDGSFLTGREWYVSDFSGGG